MDNPLESQEKTVDVRIVESATALFVAHGYEQTTVRQIAEDAGVNLAAVSYHFGGKAALYAEVIRRAREQQSQSESMPRLEDDPQHPRDVLERWVIWQVNRLLCCQKNSVVGRLMAREMAQPTEGLSQVVEKLVRPQSLQLKKLLQALLPEGTSDAVVRRHQNSLLGQIMFYCHARPVLAQLYPELYNAQQTLVESEVAPLAAHLTKVVLLALDAEGAEA